MSYDVAAERERGMRQLREFYAKHGGSNDVALPTFTCDNCPYLTDEAKANCDFLYDIYNTHGDCLAVK